MAKFVTKNHVAATEYPINLVFRCLAWIDRVQFTCSAQQMIEAMHHQNSLQSFVIVEARFLKTEIAVKYIIIPSCIVWFQKISMPSPRMFFFSSLKPPPLPLWKFQFAFILSYKHFSLLTPLPLGISKDHPWDHPRQIDHISHVLLELNMVL